MSEEFEPRVEGRHLTRSHWDFEQACHSLLGIEQEKIAPDNSLIATLCDAIRLSREHCDKMTADPRPTVPPAAVPDSVRRDADYLGSRRRFIPSADDMAIRVRSEGIAAHPAPAPAVGMEVVGLLEAVRSLLDERCGDTDITHLDEDTLKEEAPEQWMCQKVSEALDALSSLPSQPGAQGGLTKRQMEAIRRADSALHQAIYSEDGLDGSVGDAAIDALRVEFYAAFSQPPGAPQGKEGA